MRTIFVAAIALALSACATQSPPSAATPVAAPAAEKKAPQCWSGDHSAFFNLGDKTSISGVNVECKPTSDGKAAQWMGSK